jgi:hypothetical protein
MPLGLVFDRQEMRRERRSLPRFLIFAVLVDRGHAWNHPP